MKRAKNTWFDDTFLPSLFEHPRPKGFGWLSEKQFDCFVRQNGVKCRELMQQNSINGGFYVFGCVYEYTWNGQKISVFPCKSGIAQIYFGNTEEEKKNFKKEEEKKEWYKGLESCKRMKEKRPEKFAEKFKKAYENLVLCVLLFDASAASENDTDFEDSLFDLEEAEKRFYKYYFA